MYVSVRGQRTVYRGWMRWCLLWLALFGLLSAAGAQAPRKGESYQVTSIDLDGDSLREKVGLRCVEVTQRGWHSRLTVWNARGQVVWQSMPARVGVWAFGGWDWGVTDLQWVGDIDGDGSIEAVSNEPISDVSPVSFRVYRWSGKAFHHVRTAALLPAGANEFVWQSKARGGTWIGSFKKGPVAVVWVTSPAGEMRLKQARVQGGASGFRVVEWLKR